MPLLRQLFSLFTILSSLFTIPCSLFTHAQFLSHLNLRNSDPLFTTYAAPPSRSEYRNDQGYQLLWNDGGTGIEFISRDGPCTGIAFREGSRLVCKLQEYFSGAVVTTSYSDLVRYYFYPLKDIRVEVFFAVYSSQTAFAEFRIINEGHFPRSVSAIPYLYYASDDSSQDIARDDAADRFRFPLKKRRDGWMTEHNIPLAVNLNGSFAVSGCTGMSSFGFSRSTARPAGETTGRNYGPLIGSAIRLKRAGRNVKGIIREREFHLQPGEATGFRVLVGVNSEERTVKSEEGIMKSEERMVGEDEEAYSGIPRLSFEARERDKELLYWSAFSLMRQCMMPAEGACHYNYYVFSREPKWGWGYGGQVFHESLAMMAYAYMDPAGAMNSQRVFMERQRPDGYINYRTGPYLDETIETNHALTTSAPWFNYENLEVYKVTGDRQFLQEAYNSGKKFYRYYVANRDTNTNGLCEWGAHAELESVRDARVAVWDKVGWPSNFEGPDLNSMLVMEARSLSEMARILGNRADEKLWRDDAMQRSALINKTMWDTVSRFYYNVNRNDHSFTFRSPGDLKIKEIIGFLPLWAGVADKDKAADLVSKMLDTTEFWRPYGVPSLSAASDYYCPIGYWNGPVWVQWEYLLFRGLRDYGYRKEAAELADKVMRNMIFHLKNDHVFWEFYSADDLQAGWNRTYIWAGIVARFINSEK